MTAPLHRRSDHPRLGPGRLHRRGICRARQPCADADHRPGTGRPAHDHHRCGQLARRRRRTAGTGADGAHASITPSVSPPRSSSIRSSRRTVSAGPWCLTARGPLQLRCADHRHRCLGALSGLALGGEVSRPRRLGLRDLRRFFLPRPPRGGGRRRQYRGGRSAVSVEPGGPRDPDPSTRPAARREDPAGPAAGARARRQGESDLASRRRGDSRR